MSDKFINFYEINELIHSLSEHLDDEEFSKFLKLCDSNFHYRITAYSPEIRKEMIWMDQDREGMENLLSMVPEHLRRLGSIFRHVSVGKINYDNKKWIVNSSFQVTHTDLNGISKLFVVGRYTDTLVMNSNHFLLQGRLVKLETRDLGVGLHVPI